MSDEMQQEDNMIEILSDDGQILKCQIYDVIDFEEKTYALLLPFGMSEDDDDSEVIVMEYVEEDEDNAHFQTIEDEAEFNRVCDYVKSLEEEYDDEDEDEE